MTRAARALEIACDSPKQKLYRQNRQGNGGVRERDRRVIKKNNVTFKLGAYYRGYKIDFCY